MQYHTRARNMRQDKLLSRTGAVVLKIVCAMHENMRRKTSKEMENAKPGAGMSLTFNSGIFEVKVKLFFTLQCFFELKRTRSDLQ